MFTSKQYRAKAVEYGKLGKTATGSNERHSTVVEKGKKMAETIHAVLDRMETQQATSHLR